jgi:hypothetical protein
MLTADRITFTNLLLYKIMFSDNVLADKIQQIIKLTKKLLADLLHDNKILADNMMLSDDMILCQLVNFM